MSIIVVCQTRRGCHQLSDFRIKDMNKKDVLICDEGFSDRQVFR